jgi:16S rRNA (adenine1518-N6/adenine1519-N6)-dimethyltransferase
MTVYKKSLGQHILQNVGAARRIVESLELVDGDCVLEIGPGPGVLTGIMAAMPIDLVAVEIDQRFAADLKDRFASSQNVRIINESIMDVDLGALMSRNGIKLIGNLPYNLTSQILKKVFERYDLFSAVFTVQKEVAERMTAETGSREYSSLTIFVKTFCSSEKLFSLKPGSFYPPPKVSSAVVRLWFNDSIPVTADRRDAFSRFVQSIFAYRRKTILKSLMMAKSISRENLEPLLKRCAIEASARPQNLSAEQYVTLFHALVEMTDA